MTSFYLQNKIIYAFSRGADKETGGGVFFDRGKCLYGEIRIGLKWFFIVLNTLQVYIKYRLETVLFEIYYRPRKLILIINNIFI